MQERAKLGGWQELGCANLGRPVRDRFPAAELGGSAGQATSGISEPCCPLAQISGVHILTIRLALPSDALVGSLASTSASTGTGGAGD